jgi:hypothetical protein
MPSHLDLGTNKISILPPNQRGRLEEAAGVEAEYGDGEDYEEEGQAEMLWWGKGQGQHEGCHPAGGKSIYFGKFDKVVFSMIPEGD